MRNFLLVAALGALLAVLVTACGSSESGGGTLSVAENQTAKAACEEEPVSGGSLVYSRQLEVVSLNPREIKNSNGDIFADEMLYNGLVRNDPNGSAKVVPALAESWEVSKDGLTYTFHLRKGLKFSDGSPITSEDVAWNLEQFRDPEVNVSLAGVAVGMESAEAANATTVVVKLEHPVAAFLNNISIFPAFIVPKAKVESEGAAFWKHPVSSGPFVMKEFASGSQITFERNPYYFEKGKPYLETMRWNFVSNPNTRVLSLKSGEAQIADGLPLSQVESLQGDPSIAVQEVKVPQEVLLIPNTKTSGLADVNVRQAINYALNREQINTVVFKGTGSVPNSMFMPFELDASEQEVPGYEFNVEKAKEEMAKSKFPKGFSVTLMYPASLDSFKQMSLLIQQQLGEIGIDVKLEELEAATIAERWLEGDFELAYPFPGTASDVPVPDEYAAFYALPEAELDGFKSFWGDPRIEAMVKKFTVNTDEATRKSEWIAIQEAFNEELPSFNVLNFPYLNAHQANVCGTKVNGLGVDQLQETWISAGKS